MKNKITKMEIGKPHSFEIFHVGPRFTRLRILDAEERLIHLHEGYFENHKEERKVQAKIKRLLKDYGFERRISWGGHSHDFMPTIVGRK